MNTSWIYLLLAITFEVSGTVSMKLSDGFSRTGPSVAMGLCYLISLSFLTLALKRIELGVAYAIWSGLGTAMVALVGVYWFEEHLTPGKLISITLIIAGVAGLHLSTPSS